MEQNLLPSALLHRQTVCSQAILLRLPTFCLPPQGVFRHSLLREPSDTAAGLIRIEDFDLDRMYLIIGQKRAALIDAGWDYDGDLPALCHALTGGLPVDLLIAHGHPDHVAQAGKFIEYGCKVYAPMLTSL